MTAISALLLCVPPLPASSELSRQDTFRRRSGSAAPSNSVNSVIPNKDKVKDKLDSRQEKSDKKADIKADSKADSKSDSKSSKTKAEKAEQPRQDVSATASQGLKPVHLATFFIILGTGLMFLAVLLWFTADIRFQQACVKVLRRLFKTVALRHVMGILGAMTFVRFGLEPMVKMLRRLFRAPGTWEKSAEFYILREVHPTQGHHQQTATRLAAAYSMLYLE